MTAMERSSREWGGETGYVTPAMLARFVPSEARPIYYLAGPPGMVDAVRLMLSATGVTTADIRTERFTGY